MISSLEQRQVPYLCFMQMLLTRHYSTSGGGTELEWPKQLALQEKDSKGSRET